MLRPSRSRICSTWNKLLRVLPVVAVPVVVAPPAVVQAAVVAVVAAAVVVAVVVAGTFKEVSLPVGSLRLMRGALPCWQRS